VNLQRNSTALATKGVRCHGPQTYEAGLRLDEREAALGKLESGNRAIVRVVRRQRDSKRVTADPLSGCLLKVNRSANSNRDVTRMDRDRRGWPIIGLIGRLNCRRRQVSSIRNWRAGFERQVDRFILKSCGIMDCNRRRKRIDSLSAARVFRLDRPAAFAEEVDVFLSDKSPDAYERLV